MSEAKGPFFSFVFWSVARKKERNIFTDSFTVDASLSESVGVQTFCIAFMSGGMGRRNGRRWALKSEHICNRVEGDKAAIIITILIIIIARHHSKTQGEKSAILRGTSGTNDGRFEAFWANLLVDICD